jgi:Protein  of unknown function (DUF3018)
MPTSGGQIRLAHDHAECVNVLGEALDSRSAQIVHRAVVQECSILVRRSRRRIEGKPYNLRKAGLRPVQIWVPDVRSRSFARAAHRQSLAVARSPYAKQDQEFVDAISAWNAE